VETGFADYKDALADSRVDAVWCHPTSLHKDIVLQAHGPATRVVREAHGHGRAGGDEMDRRLRRGEGEAADRFMRRYDRASVRRKRGSRRGDRRVVLVKSVGRAPAFPRNGCYDNPEEQRPLAEVNSHDIDSSRWFAGSDIDEVYAIGGILPSAPGRFRIPGLSTTHVAMVCRFETGSRDDRRGSLRGYATNARMGSSAPPLVFVG